MSSPPSCEGWHTDSGRHAIIGPTTAHAVPAHESEIRLTVPARPENVALVRHVMSALADALGLPRGLTDDMRLAVTEACTNVVRHAYEDRGTIDAVVCLRSDSIEVIVADEGRGIGPSPDTDGPGLGLPLIAALADSVEIEQAPSRGSRLKMRFQRPAPALGLT